MATAAFRLSDAGTAAIVSERAGRAEVAHSAAAEAYAFDLVTSRAAFDRLEAEWNELFARAGRPAQVFQTFSWCWHWCNHFLDGRSRLAVVTARRGGRLVLILPLIAEHTAGLTRLVWLGEPVSQYGDAILDHVDDPLAVLDGAWRHVTQNVRVDLVHLRKVRADAAVASFLRRIGASVTHATQAPYLDLASAKSFAAYEQRYSGKARKNRRRLMRRLEEQGPVAVAHYREGAEASTLVVEGLALKRAWLKTRGILSPALADPRTERFFAAMASDRLRSTGCEVSVLRSNGRAAGVQLGFACKGRLAMHVIVYDLEFEKSGVGVLHLERAIQHAYKAGHGTIDLLAPNDAYKMDWADGTVAVEDHAQPLSFKGRVFVRLYLGHLRQRLKALARRVPGFARAVLPLTAVL